MPWTYSKPVPNVGSQADVLAAGVVHFQRVTLFVDNPIAREEPVTAGSNSNLNWQQTDSAYVASSEQGLLSVLSSVDTTFSTLMRPTMPRFTDKLTTWLRTHVHGERICNVPIAAIKYCPCLSYLPPDTAVTKSVSDRTVTWKRGVDAGFENCGYSHLLGLTDFVWLNKMHRPEVNVSTNDTFAVVKWLKDVH